jgi:hypothetical protein
VYSNTPTLGHGCEQQQAMHNMHKTATDKETRWSHPTMSNMCLGRSQRICKKTPHTRQSGETPMPFNNIVNHDPSQAYYNVFLFFNGAVPPAANTPCTSCSSSLLTTSAQVVC